MIKTSEVGTWICFMLANTHPKGMDRWLLLFLLY